MSGFKSSPKRKRGEDSPTGILLIERVTPNPSSSSSNVDRIKELSVSHFDSLEFDKTSSFTEDSKSKVLDRLQDLLTSETPSMAFIKFMDTDKAKNSYSLLFNSKYGDVMINDRSRDTKDMPELFGWLSKELQSCSCAVIEKYMSRQVADKHSAVINHEIEAKEDADITEEIKIDEVIPEEFDYQVEDEEDNTRAKKKSKTKKKPVRS